MTRAESVVGERALRAVLVVCGVVGISGLAWHNMDIVGDGFWYIASGRWLALHRAVPQWDPYSYASDGKRWMIVNPGACALFALVADHLGLRALMAICTLVETLAVALVWMRAARTTAARLLLLPWALFFIYVDAGDLSARGQVFGDLGFVLLLGAFARLRDGKRVHPALIVLGAAAWTNLHPSFLMLLLVPLGAAAALMLEAPRGRPRVLPFVSIVPLALLGTMATVYGPRYLSFAFDLGFTATNDDFDLFQSPNLHDPAWLAAPLVGIALLVLRQRYGSPTCRLAEQAFLLVFVVAACVSRRYATELIAVEIGLLGPMLDGVTWPSSAWLSRGALVAALLAGAAGVAWLSQGNDPLKNVPVVAAEVARAAQRAAHAEGRAMDQVVNPLHWGGYLAYAWRGDPKYFVDGRDQVRLFGNGVYADSVALRRGLPTYAAFAELLDAYEAGVVLEERGLPLDLALRQSPAWRLVHEGRFAVVYVRAK